MKSKQPARAKAAAAAKPRVVVSNTSQRVAITAWRGEAPRRTVIVVHGWKHVSAALQAAGEARANITLISPAGASYTHGAAFWAAIVKRAQALFPTADAEIVLDCDGAPGHALAAFRVGLKTVAFAGNAAAAARLMDIAQRHDARLIERPPTHLDLIHSRDPLAACQALLAGREG
ncbi:MAG: hypothetical protein KF889_21255 [Alphaproteobacteria bacterium]|nr:hypothetical protein [Alphaproteobacteria bacterium]MCW5743168.1 hypothetical protein [Alphaproteobacteria bacterium]